MGVNCIGNHVKSKRKSSVDKKVLEFIKGRRPPHKPKPPRKWRVKRRKVVKGGVRNRRANE